MSRAKHDAHFHVDGTDDAVCSACGQRIASASPAALAAHRVSTCPSKPILCRFCHLQVPQGGGADAAADAVAALAGLTPHEQADGARTADCHVCGRPVRLRDAAAHARHHEMDKKGRLPPVPVQERHVREHRVRPRERRASPGSGPPTAATSMRTVRGGVLRPAARGIREGATTAARCGAASSAGT